MALTAVFIEGIIFVLLTLFNVRELIVRSIPNTIKNAIPVGIGLFITFVGLQNGGLIVRDENTMLALGSMADKHVWVALLGLVLTAVLYYKRVHGAFLIGIVVATLFALALGLVQVPEGSLVSLPPSLSPIFLKFDWSHIFTLDMLIVVFTFLFVNLFDTVGTLIGVASKIGITDKDGNFPQLKPALLADALGTTVGAMLGTSTIISYVESASGVAAGGRTGLTSLSTATMFALALFFAPLFLMVPPSATAPCPDYRGTLYDHIGSEDQLRGYDGGAACIPYHRDDAFRVQHRSRNRVWYALICISQGTQRAVQAHFRCHVGYLRLVYREVGT